MAVDPSWLRAHHGQPALPERLARRAVQNVEGSASAPTQPPISTVGVLMCSRTACGAGFSTFCTRTHRRVRDGPDGTMSAQAVEALPPQPTNRSPRREMRRPRMAAGGGSPEIDSRDGLYPAAHVKSAPRRPAKLPTRAIDDDPHRRSRGPVRSPRVDRGTRAAGRVGGRRGARGRGRGLRVEPPCGGRWRSRIGTEVGQGAQHDRTGRDADSLRRRGSASCGLRTGRAGRPDRHRVRRQHPGVCRGCRTDERERIRR